MTTSEVASDEYHPYYRAYIDACGEGELFDFLTLGLKSFSDFISSIPEEKLPYKYEEGKWTVAEVLVHLFDAERVFQYRALRFARNDQTGLVGFEQDDYVPQSRSNDRTKDDLIREYGSIRNSVITLFNSFNEIELLRKGKASDAQMSVRALGFVINGHQKHHQRILVERYGL